MESSLETAVMSKTVQTPESPQEIAGTSHPVHETKETSKVGPLPLWDSFAVNINTQVNTGMPPKATTERAEHRANRTRAGVSDGLYDLMDWVRDLVHGTQKEEQADNNTPVRGLMSYGSESVKQLRKDLEAFLSEMQHLVYHIKELLDTEDSELQLDEYLISGNKAQALLKEDQFRTSKLHMDKQFEEKKLIDKERTEKLNTVLASTQKSRFWGMAETFLTGACMLGSAATITTAGGFLAFVFSALILADEFFDDAGKHKIASLLSNSPQKEEEWFERIKIGCGVATVMIALYLMGAQIIKNSKDIFKASKLVTEAPVNLLKGSTTAGRGLTDYQRNVEVSKMLDLKTVADSLGGKINNTVKSLKTDDIHKLYDSMRKIIEGKFALLSSINQA
jgi:hypothetical protein